MKLRAATLFFILLFGILAFNSGYVIGQSPWAPFQVFSSGEMPAEAEEAFAPLWEVYSLVQTRYFERPIDNELLAEGAINGMLAALDDPYSRYLSPADEAAERDSMQGEISGIGVEITSEDGFLTVISPIEGSPAEAAGLVPGDRILEADGISLLDLDVGEAAQIVRGPVGTSVLLVIERDGETFDLEVMRDIIKIASVRGEILEDNIAYLRLSQFSFDTAVEVEKILKELLAENPAGLIVDVRRNPGGSLQTVVDVADQFLTEGPVLVQDFGAENKRTFSADDNDLAEEIPLVILIDEGSASASEVLAGAIRDRGRGILLGQTSFGKGTVQTWHELSNQGGLRITIARWLTPDENWINKTGLDPDIFIPLPEFEEGVDFEDTQLQAAIDYLLGKEVLSIPPAEKES
ncbi:MAG: S41 family peptidase [Anaerolineales bacterium]|nr:S41 family peptidase [Anaerolineales bacterium]